MALKSTVENLDDVPEDHRSFYVEADDIFVLDVEDIDTHPKVAGLSGAYKAEKSKRQDQGKQLKSANDRADAAERLSNSMPSDFDIDVWEKAKTGKTDTDSQLVALREKFETDLAERDVKLADLKTTHNSMLIERALDDALAPVGITDPLFMESARMLLKRRVKFGDDGKMFMESDMGPVSIADGAQEFASGKGRGFVTPPKGGGGKGNDGGVKGSEKTISRADFEALRSVDQAKAMKDGIKVIA